MNISDAAGLLFSGMEKLGPGDNEVTRHVLSLLPKHRFSVIVDAGCGTGRQTFVLARELGWLIHAVDSYKPFLTDLSKRAIDAKLEHRIQTHCMDMAAIPDVFPEIDLLWSEGAAYNMGFSNALTTWAISMTARGFVIVSELTWLKEQAPEAVKEFFRTGYPEMKSIEENSAVARKAGYKVLSTFTLPSRAWIDGFYDVLGPRAKALLDHRDSTVRDFAAETLREIEVFEASDDSYGYVFYVLQRR
jgi:trans-aconitate methyltransferase